MQSSPGVVTRVVWALALTAFAWGGAARTQDVPAAGAGGAGAGGVHRFEVASVRPANRNDGRHWYGARLTPSGRYEVSGMPLSLLVRRAYIEDGGQPARVGDGGVKWAESSFFDIEAKLDDGDLVGWDKLTGQQRGQIAQAALRTLLEERFQLKVHTETHIEPLYVLVQAKGGAKLKEVAAPLPESPEEADARMQGRSSTKVPPGGFMMTGEDWIATAVPVQVLLGQIQHEFKLDHMLLDETGLKGYYAFDLKRSHEKDARTFQDLVEQELGLRVEARKRPVTVYVIDAAEKPTEN